MFRLLRGPIERYARWSSAHPVVPPVVIVAVSVLCLFLARRIGLDASFDALLPEGEGMGTVLSFCFSTVASGTRVFRDTEKGREAAPSPEPPS